jgi:hypothetical protein
MHDPTVLASVITAVGGIIAAMLNRRRGRPGKDDQE